MKYPIRASKVDGGSLDALIGYFTPYHVINQRLLLQFLSAPEDGRKSVRNMYSIIAVTNKHTAKLHHVGSLYILSYDARKLKHKIHFTEKQVFS